VLSQVEKIGVVRVGRSALPAGAKKLPNPPDQAPEKPGKKRGAGRGE